jgi:hypothetical protein
MSNGTATLKFVLQRLDYNGAYEVSAPPAIRIHTSSYGIGNQTAFIPSLQNYCLNGQSPYQASFDHAVMTYWIRNWASYNPPTGDFKGAFLRTVFIEFSLSFASITSNQIQITLNQRNRVFEGLGGDSLQPGDHSATITLTKVY